MEDKDRRFLRLVAIMYGATLVITYLAFSFMQLSLDPTAWKEGFRIGAAVIGVFFPLAVVFGEAVRSS